MLKCYKISNCKFRNECGFPENLHFAIFIFQWNSAFVFKTLNWYNYSSKQYSVTGIMKISQFLGPGPLAIQRLERLAAFLPRSFLSKGSFLLPPCESGVSWLWVYFPPQVDVSSVSGFSERPIPYRILNRPQYGIHPIVPWKPLE